MRNVCNGVQTGGDFCSDGDTNALCNVIQELIVLYRRAAALANLCMYIYIVKHIPHPR